MMMRYAIGLDIGVTNVKAVGVTALGEVLFRRAVGAHWEWREWPARGWRELGGGARDGGGAECCVVDAGDGSGRGGDGGWAALARASGAGGAFGAYLSRCGG